MKVLFTTICIGKKYIEQYKKIFYKSQKEYCEKHNYSFLCLENILSPINHPDAISFNKALVFSQDFAKLYDLVVFIDADVLINSNAPAIHQMLKDHNRIGMVDEFSQPNKLQRFHLQRKMGWEKTAKEYYALSGFDIDTNSVLNTGLLIGNPMACGDFLREIYIKNSLNCIGHPRRFHFEQSAIGFFSQKNNMHEIIDSRFNTIFLIHHICDKKKSTQDIIQENFFIHFAGIKIDAMETIFFKGLD